VTPPVTETKFQFPVIVDSLPVATAYYSINKPSPQYSIINAVGKIGDTLINGRIKAQWDYDERIKDTLKDFSGLQMFVDTLHEVSADSYPHIPLPFFESLYPIGSPERKIDSLENELHYPRKESSVYFKAFPVFIVNVTSGNVLVNNYDQSLFITQEALDSSGTWRSITLEGDYSCGNGFGRIILQPNFVLMTKVLIYKGNYSTLMRVKMENGYSVIYSKPFCGSINYTQFVVKNSKRPH
jgi:hypothetical protein